MHVRSVQTRGVPLTIIDGQVGRTYRAYYRQVLAKSIYGSNAATPGYSNHGLAVAIDLMSSAQRSSVDAIGRYYGFSKGCSDASWEWWHIKYNPGCTGAGYRPAAPKPDPLRHLSKPERYAVERLQYHRRQMRLQARSGKGPKWRTERKWAIYWRKRVKKYMRKLVKARNRRRNGGWKRYNRGSRYQILSRVWAGKKL